MRGVLWWEKPMRFKDPWDVEVKNILVMGNSLCSGQEALGQSGEIE